MNKTKGTKLIIGVFTAFMAIVCLLYVFVPKSNFSYSEKRYLQQFPEVSWDNIKSGKFSTQFEKFLADQIPLRKAFVSINAYYELIKGNNGANGIYLGKDGYLIEKPYERDNRLEMNLDRIIKFASQTGKETTLIAVPSKGYVYGDKLPKNSMDYLDDEYCDKISDLTNGSLCCIDLRDTLKENAKDNQLFYKTDHHWTADGAFTAYKELCKVKYNVVPDIKDYNIETYNNFYGTSYSTSCYSLTKPDDVKLYVNKANSGKADIEITEGTQISKYNDFYFRKNLDEPEGDLTKGDTNANTGDKYTVYLDGNHTLVTIKTGNEGGKLLLIKDSFAHCFVPFLAEKYSEIIMVDLRYYKQSLTELIANENIDEIMFLYSVENLCTSRDIILR